ncbi:hypothetical protein [Amycolatopsis sp. NPDC051372]|uniref:hypothetical protein n=1 Tax=unclassified Amycolatopsis TaxID=2618356 RepID=UPI0034263469
MTETTTSFIAHGSAEEQSLSNRAMRRAELRVSRQREWSDKAGEMRIERFAK